MQLLLSLSGIIPGKSSAVCGGILAVKNRNHLQNPIISQWVPLVLVAILSKSDL